MAYPNPYEVIIPPDMKVFIQCIANASYYQRVFCQYNTTGGLEVFLGSGEGQIMYTDNSGSSAFTLPPNPDGYNLWFTFSFNTDVPYGEFQDGVINNQPTTTTSGPQTITTITSEDGADSDNNDTVCTLIYQPWPSPIL